MGSVLPFRMRVIAKRTLREFWESRPSYADAAVPLDAWYAEVSAARWTSPNDVKAQYRSASFVTGKIVFNIGGNKYRLIVDIDYPRAIVYIKFVGTHEQYDSIDIGSL